MRIQRMGPKPQFLGIKDAAAVLAEIDPDGKWSVSRIMYYVFDKKRGKRIKRRRDHVTMKPQIVGDVAIWTRRQLAHWIRRNQWSKARKHELLFGRNEVMQLTGLSAPQIRYQIRLGRVTPLEIGSSHLFTLADVTFLNRLTDAAADADVLAERVAAVLDARERESDATEDAPDADTGAASSEGDEINVG